MEHPTDIPLRQARRLIARAIDKAAHIGVRGAFAVVGGSGMLVSASRMDRGGAGGMARARSKAWISATQQIPSTEHHLRMATLPAPIAAGFVACSPDAMFPGAGGMPIYSDSGVVVGGFSASGATIGPFVDIPGIDRRMLIADGKPANSEDLVVLWTLGLPYEGQHGDDEKRWLDAFGELPDEPGLGYETPPPASQPEHEWALALADAAIAAAVARETPIAVAVVDSRGDPIQQDTMDGAPSAAPLVAEAVAAGAATFQRPSTEIDPTMTTVLPYRVLTVAGGLPVRDGDRVVAGLGVAGPITAVCQEIAESVLA
ncbi:MAG TPA: heme-binding protein [Solirubrobacteraceae bacterium]|nr:heme-binding protein [Solirubrobacteraceae bacterium]